VAGLLAGVGIAFVAAARPTWTRLWRRRGGGGAPRLSPVHGSHSLARPRRAGDPVAAVPWLLDAVGAGVAHAASASHLAATGAPLAAGLTDGASAPVA